jgi:MerR family copper efflux transcriptional regulator
MSEDQHTRLSIGQVARRAGVSTQAIRYYERIGLLPRPMRSANGYRWYATLDVQRVQLLQRMRSLGTPLAAAKPVVDRAAEARCAEIQHDLLDLAQQRLDAINHQIAALVAQRAEVQRFRRALEAVCLCPDTSFAACDDVTCVTEPETCRSEEVFPMLLIEHACCDCCGDADCTCCAGDGCTCCQTA